MAPLHPEAIKKKAKMPNKIFDTNHTEKKAGFLKFGVKKAKLATLTLYRPDFQKLANNVEIHSRYNAGKISENCKSCNLVFVFII